MCVCCKTSTSGERTARLRRFGLYDGLRVLLVIFRQLTSLNDWTFGKGISGYATAEDAVQLNIKTRLQSWKGDCFFALDDFVDWLGRLDKGQEKNLLNELKTVILQSFGVVAVNSVQGVLDHVTRNYRLTFNITTIYGTTFQNNLDLTAGVPPGSIA